MNPRLTPDGRAMGLRSRVTIAMIVVAVIPLLTLWIAATVRERADHREATLGGLTAIANIQAARVTALGASMEDALRLVSSSRDFRDDLQALGAGEPGLRTSLIEQLTDARQSATNLLDAFALDLSGQVLASSDAARVGERWPSATQIDLSDEEDVRITLPAPDAPDRLRIVLPIVQAGSTIGLAGVEWAAGPLQELATDYDGLGATGETLVSTRGADGAIQIITPTRSATSSDAAVLVGAEATWGESAELEDVIDYRGEPVFAVRQYIDTLDWTVTVKLDRGEALASLTSLARLALFSLLLALLVAIALAFVAAEGLVRPIRQITDTAQAIGAGNLRRRAQADNTPEIGALADAVNEMADALVSMQLNLEDQVELRTHRLQQLVKELELRNRELDDFSSVAAHDLKSPLTIVRGTATMLTSDRPPSPEIARDMLERSLAAANRMQRLIDDLLTLARAGRVEIDAVRVDLGAVIRECGENLGPTVLCEVAAIPPVRGDAVLLNQLFANLFSNSVKYAEPGRPVQIGVWSVPDDQAVTIHVDDNGKGIPEDQRERVFDAFTRVDATSDTEGTGVGLTIVARIVAQHGGTITLGESPAGGTRVSVQLPLASAQDPSMMSTPASAQSISATVSPEAT